MPRQILITLHEQTPIINILKKKGGTTDITVLEKLSDGKLKQLCRSQGADCGGSNVENEFIQFLIRIFGAPLVNLLKEKEPYDYMEFMQEFELKKRDIRLNSSHISIRLPQSLPAFCEKYQEETLSSMIESSPYVNKIRLYGNRMKIDPEIWKSFFTKTLENIVTLVDDVLQNLGTTDGLQLILVGGFADNELVQHAVQRQFCDKKVIIPNEPSLSVLKGAVVFGHMPEYISSRVLRYTYGTNVNEIFDPDTHEPRRKIVTAYGEERCRGTLSIVIPKNMSVTIGTKITHSYSTTVPNQSKMDIKMYASDKENVKYTDDDSCIMIGKAVVEIPFPSKEKRSVKVEYIFGNTEISMTAEDLKHGKKCKAGFNLI